MHKKWFFVFIFVAIVVCLIKIFSIIAFLSFDFAISKYKDISEHRKTQFYFAEENMLKTKILPYSEDIIDKESETAKIFVENYTTNINGFDILPANMQIKNSGNSAILKYINQYIVLNNKILFIVQNCFKNSDSLFFTEIYEYNLKTKALKNIGWFEGRYDGAEYKLLEENLLLLYGGTQIREGESESGHKFENIMLIYLR